MQRLSLILGGKASLLGGWTVNCGNFVAFGSGPSHLLALILCYSYDRVVSPEDQTTSAKFGYSLPDGYMDEWVPIKYRLPI